MAVAGKQLWAVSSKADTLWVRWINGVYLKGCDFWSYNAPNDFTWYWRKLNKLKSKFQPGYMAGRWMHSFDGVCSITSGYT